MVYWTFSNETKEGNLTSVVKEGYPMMKRLSKMQNNLQCTPA
jgi:hypothetical protein